MIYYLEVISIIMRLEPQTFIQRGENVSACFLDCSKAFDKCLFSKLFLKMQTKGIPTIVIRALTFAYEEQEAWVRLIG